MISEVLPIIVSFFFRNPIVGHDNRLMTPDNGVQYIVVSFLLGPVGFP